MPIVWREALSIGYRQIDDDHKHLIDLINSVEAAITGEFPLRRLFNAIEDLFDYTKRHFVFEEHLMSNAMYVNIESHKAAHLELIHQLKQATQPILDLPHGDGETTSTVAQEDRDELVALLRHWLIDHVIKEDMQLKPVL